MALTGQILDVASADYYRDEIDDRPSLNASLAKLLLNESPRHAWNAHPRLNPNYEPIVDSKFDVGTVVHKLLLEPERESRVTVVDAKDWRTKAAQEARDQAREEGNIPLLEGEWRRVMEMLDAVKPQLRSLDVDPLPFTDGKAEQTVVWTERDVLCRARLDWLHTNGAISDLKTTKYSANPLKWSQRVLWSIGAHIQTVVYQHAVHAALGVENAPFVFVIAETAPPYAVSTVSVGPSGLALAKEQWTTALDTWKTCLETDTWPAYPTSVVKADAPAWLESAWWESQQYEEAA